MVSPRIAVILCLVVAGCSKARDESGSKRSPAPPPPPSVEIPDDLLIPVAVSGNPTAPITAAILEDRAADFSDDEHRSWRLDGLLEGRLGEGDGIEAVNKSGISVLLPKASRNRVAVLYLTRRGEVGAAMVNPVEPFPDYHGQGGRLGRPGNPLPRAAPVIRLVIHPRAAAPPDARAALAAIELIVDGAPVADLDDDATKALAAAGPKIPGRPAPVWRLRSLAAAVAGEDGRAVKVVGENESVDIDADQWKGERTPLLMTNRRGLVKLVWLEGEAMLDGVRGVVRIEFAR